MSSRLCNWNHALRRFVEKGIADLHRIYSVHEETETPKITCVSRIAFLVAAKWHTGWWSVVSLSEKSNIFYSEERKWFHTNYLIYCVIIRKFAVRKQMCLPVCSALLYVDRMSQHCTSILAQHTCIDNRTWFIIQFKKRQLSHRVGSYVREIGRPDVWDKIRKEH